jgi:tubulin polyglutamylase TTLL9
LNFFKDVHITNNAIQKQAPNYDPDKGAKWSIQNLRQYLIAKHGIENVHYFILN